jgi:hypothetical protein
LVKDSGIENIVNRLPESERWTHWWASKNRVSQLDYILLSPALSSSSSADPYIERGGISAKRTKSYYDVDGQKGAEVDLSFKRFKAVTDEIDASDHCPVFFELTM